MGARSSGGYLGYLEAGRPQREYLSGNATRHTQVRATYDPDGIIL